MSLRTHLHLLALCLCFAMCAADLHADTHFVEAEDFQVTGNGWRTFAKGADPSVAAASGTRTLWGGDGPGDSVATAQIEVTKAGRYRLWTRYMEGGWRGPFSVRVRQDGREVAARTFDIEPRPGVETWQFEWSPIDEVQLAEGFATIELAKHEKKNCNHYARHVDCFLLTDDLQLKPSHVAYGPQTWLRVTLGEIYDKPVYVEIFADHFRSPWYAHYSISKAGLEASLNPSRPESLMRGGESTDWINISEMVYQDSGVILVTTVRENYHKICPRLKARFEFATAPSEKDIVRTLERDATPGAINLIVPPNLITPENRERLTMDTEIAEATGRVADRFRWPTIGKKPTRHPFLVSQAIQSWLPHDQKVVDREWKTLDYFGFNNRSKHVIGGAWRMANNCYSQPEIDKMKADAQSAAAAFRTSGKKVEDIVWSLLMDEPQGPPIDHVAECPACGAAFGEWLRSLTVSPAELGVSDWAAVKPVATTNNPALYYFSQRFRSQVLGKFTALQRAIVRDAYGVDIPAGPNYSDGATYLANMYLMGIDYFELLDSDSQNALWSENWGNGAASRQCTTYNVELMRSAAMKRGQTLGHYLIAYAGRLPWDIKLNAVSQAARDVKVFENFWYGPSWAGHEGGPPWSCSGWYAKPYTWFANAELVREFGGAEDLLLPARKARSSVAILYSSSADIWTLGRNHAYGFDRMFLWLALTHRQVPVDFLSEKMVAEDEVSHYRVCYLSGPNLTRAAAEKLVAWVKRGGVLVLTAGAASRDEFNQPLTILDEILPATRTAIEELQPYHSSGGGLHRLRPLDTAIASTNGPSFEVLSVKQALTPKPGAEILGTFSNGVPAYVSARFENGQVYQAGFLPGLSYMRPALVARQKLAEAAGKLNAADIPESSAVVPEEALLRRSQSPWQYPGTIRELITKPVIDSKTPLPIQCDVPLVDAVLMEGEHGAVVPLANYTLQPLKRVTLTVTTKHPVQRVETVHHGKLSFRRKAPTQVEFKLPLRETDFVLLHYGSLETIREPRRWWWPF